MAKPGETATPSKPKILRYFRYDHLPEPLRSISHQLHDLAHEMAVLLPDTAERAVFFRKLLEAKDAAVRAALPDVVEEEPASGRFVGPRASLMIDGVRYARVRVGENEDGDPLCP